MQTMENNVIKLVSNKGKVQTQTETCVVIPARLNSTRFPEKMLAHVEGDVTLIEYVYNQCQQAHNALDVYVLTDSNRIAELFPPERVIMTSPDCENGTARVASIIDKLPYSNIINVQGDMIKFPKNIIKDIRIKMINEDIDVITVCKEMDTENQNDFNTVKCINNGEKAHWFLRAATSYGDWHLGIYGYTKRALAQYPYLTKYAEEQIESLEQLRWIQNGIDITITFTYGDAAEINSREDLKNWQSTV